MERRALIGVVGSIITTSLAGCSSSEESDYEEGNTGSENEGGGSADGSTDGSSSDDSKADTEGSTEAEAETETDTDTSTQDEPEQLVELVEHELVRNEGEYRTELYVEGEAKNLTSETLSYVEVNVRWYDSEGTQLDTGVDNVTDLQANGSWAFKVTYIGTDKDKVADYDIATDVSNY
jgi:hypothetical protein